MSHKNYFMNKTFITLVTFQRLLSIVCFLITQNPTSLSNTFITVITFKRLLTSCGSSDEWIDIFWQKIYHTDHIKMAFLRCAFLTFKRFLSIVYCLMNYKIIFIGKTFITLITFKRLVTTVCSLMNYMIMFIEKH